MFQSLFNILKRGFNDIKFDLVQNILNVEGNTQQNIFAGLFIILLALLFVLMIKQLKEVIKLKQHNKKTRKNIERLWMLPYKDKKNDKTYCSNWIKRRNW